jgi:hypothetical protein
MRSSLAQEVREISATERRIKPIFFNEELSKMTECHHGGAEYAERKVLIRILGELCVSAVKLCRERCSCFVTV